MRGAAQYDLSFSSAFSVVSVIPVNGGFFASASDPSAPPPRTSYQAPTTLPMVLTATQALNNHNGDLLGSNRWVASATSSQIQISNDALASMIRATPIDCSAWYGWSASTGGGWALRFSVAQATQLVIDATQILARGGRSQALPLLPDNGRGFTRGPSGNWFDPPLALGFEFQQSGTSLFTDILSLPVGIDADGFFEVQVGSQSLGRFAEGTRVDFRHLLVGNGVPSFRIFGIDPAVDSTDVRAFPVQLAFDTPTADFTMTPLTWRRVGSSCTPAVACASCPAVAIDPVGDAVTGNSAFALNLTDGPSGGVGVCLLGFGGAAVSPLPILCGQLHPNLPLIDLGSVALAGSGICDGSGTVPLAIPNQSGLYGLFVTVQSVFLCPAGGLGLTHGLEFPIGS
ncbi:MAG: hypothetical protein U1F36_00070 [Planctomycetota bacterium]